MRIFKTKIVQKAKAGETISYGELVDGTYLVDPSGGTSAFDLNRDDHTAVLTGLLFTLGRDSLERNGFINTAVIVQKESGTPGKGFYRLAAELGVLANEADEVERTSVWEVQRDATWRSYGAPPVITDI